MEIDLKTVFLIIFISSLMGLTYNYFSPSGIPIFPEKKTLKQASDSLFYPSITNSGNISSEEIIEKENAQTEPLSINLKQAYELYKRDILFIDAREPEDYKIGHIKNAINIPADHFDYYEFKLNKIDKDQPVVTYCAGSDCDLSIVLGNILSETGYKKIFVFFDGWDKWIDAKYPVEINDEK